MPTKDELLDLLEEAGEVIATLHGLLPDDGKEHGTAPSWWAEGTQANAIRAQIANVLREAGRSYPSGESEDT